eukprot:NODE_368_length_10016_cov_0.215791.p1 type:complete len:570 gc:universal NODE_368_length_10016_cov_0.215791:317-2026(+)
MLKKNELVAFNDLQGYVKYVGAVHFRTGVWVGIELTQPNGKNDGEVDFKGTRRRYFKCKPNHGLFARESNVVKVQSKMRMPRKRSTLSNLSGINSNYSYPVSRTYSYPSSTSKKPRSNTDILRSTLEEYQNQITQKDDEIEEKDSKINELQHELISGKRKMIDMERKLDKFSADIKKFEESYDPEKVNHLKLENIKLQQTLSEADNEIKLIQEHYAKVIDSQKLTVQQLQNSSTLKNADSIENKKLKLKTEEQAAKISHLEIMLEKLDTNTAKSEVESQFQSDKNLHDYQMKNASLEVAISSIENKNERLENQLEKLKAELSSSRNTMVELQKEKSNLLTENGGLKKKIQMLPEDENRSSPDNADAYAELSLLKAEKQSMEDLFEIKENNLKTEIDMTKKSNEMLKHKIAQLNIEYQTKCDEVFQLSTKLLNVENKTMQIVSELEAELDESAHEKLLLENEIKSKDSLYIRLQEESASLKVENERLLKLSANLKKSRRQTMTNYMENVDRLMTDMSKIQDTISEKRTSSNRSSLIEIENNRMSKLSDLSSKTYDEEMSITEAGITYKDE